MQTHIFNDLHLNFFSFTVFFCQKFAQRPKKVPVATINCSPSLVLNLNLQLLLFFVFSNFIFKARLSLMSDLALVRSFLRKKLALQFEPQKLSNPNSFSDCLSGESKCIKLMS